MNVQIANAAALLALPFNLAALAAGILLGLIGARVANRAGLAAPALLALLFPIAALLDPATALILLASAWAAALAADAPGDQMMRGLGLAALTGLAVLLATGPALALVPKFGAHEKIALLAAAAALAVISHAGTTSAAWASALGLIVAGVAVELSPWRPIDSAQTSPRAVLLGLLALGPAVAVLARPAPLAVVAITRTPEWPASLLPLLLLAMPVTVTAALLSLTLSEYGLSAGHALITQRTRLVVVLVLAALIATVAATLVLLATRRVPRATWMRKLDDALMMRLAATAIAAFALIVMMAVSGVRMERAELAMLAGAALVGGALQWFGVSPLPLIIGLTIGELMRPALAPAAKIGLTDLRSGLLAAFAGLSILASLAWPWLRGRFPGTIR